MDKILIVEDDKTLQETLAYNLERQGYFVKTAGDGKEGIRFAREIAPDLIVLDIMLPVLDGFEVCRILRQESNVPILILTAKDEEIDRVIGLELGADDYLTKPFSVREFLARVKAHLRRARFDREGLESKPPVARDSLAFGDLILDLVRREVRYKETPLQLKPKEYDLLLFFAQHKGQLVTREVILERVWGWDFTGGSRTVDVHVRWLREKIERDPSKPERIVTVRGAGYRFEG